MVVKVNSLDLSKGYRGLRLTPTRDRVNARIANAFALNGNHNKLSNQPTSQSTLKALLVKVFPSGDLQLITTTAAEAERLRKDHFWATALSPKATVLVPMFGAVVHGFPVEHVDLTRENWKKTAEKKEHQNRSLLPVNAGIKYVEWLVKRP